MRNWTTMPTNLVRNHQIKAWKKRHLRHQLPQTTLPTGYHEPVFRANKPQDQQTKELADFLHRLRSRS